MKRCIGIVLLLALAFALTAYAETTWECAVCHRRVQASLGDTCPYCGAERHVHTWQDATCTEPKTCTVCGATEGKALGHRWDEGTAIQEANCQTIGVKSYTCTACGTIREESIPKDKTNHIGGIEVKGKRDATCTAEGYTGDTYCKSCGELISRGSAIPAANHQWDEGTVLLEATCQMIGAKRYSCTVCGAKRDEVIPEDQTNHTGGTEIRGVLDASCTTDGYTGDTYCKGCGGLISKGNVIRAPGHSWKEATCTQPKTCSRCGTTEGTALGHSWQDATYTAPKTCRKCGMTEGEPLEQSVEVGEILTFGHYPQTASGTDNTPIEWIVLDVQGSKALLVSEYGLDAKPYNAESVKITWETCSLRKWLNGEFLNTAFSSEEQSKIIRMKISNSENPVYHTEGGYDTDDQVFLLSIDEANKYFASDAARITKPTAYANSNGALKDDRGNCWWWLRSPGNDQTGAAGVGGSGVVRSLGSIVNNVTRAIRPALWVNLESGIF